MAWQFNLFCGFPYLGLTAWLAPSDVRDDKDDDDDNDNDEDEDPRLGPDCFAREKKLLNHRSSDMKLKELKYKNRLWELNSNKEEGPGGGRGEGKVSRDPVVKYFYFNLYEFYLSYLRSGDGRKSNLCMSRATIYRS